VIALSILLALGAVPEPRPPTIALVVEESAGLDSEGLADLLHELAVGLGRHTGLEIAIEHAGFEADCAPRAECVRMLLARHPAAELVALRVFGGPRLLRLGFERIDGAGTGRGAGEIDLSRDPALRAEPIQKWSEQWFADRSKIIAPSVEATIEPEPSVLPWVIFGGAAVSAIAGVVFAVDAESARSDAMMGPRFSDEQDQLRDRVATSAIAADLLFGTAALAGVTAVVWLLVE
jgi:hypothetical protein